MKTSERGIKDLILSEGKRNQAYQDSGGVWTIGVGHTASAGSPKPYKGLVLTDKEVEDTLARDLAKFEKRVNEFLPNVTQNVFDGAVAFDFNTGAIDTASWVRAFKAGDYLLAEQKFKLWNKDNGKTIAGLVTRRAREADLIFRDKYVTKPIETTAKPETSQSQHQESILNKTFLQSLFEFIINLIKGNR